MVNGKVLVHLRAPVFTKSGYGAHAREVLDYLLSDDRLIVALESINWGMTGFIHEEDGIAAEKIQQYYQCRANYDQLNGKAEWDISVQVTIPNEFKRVAQLNIGVTAGIETDRVSREWIQKCNEMDMIVVPSKHSANVLGGTAYLIQNKETGKTTEERVTRPIFVIPEYFERPAQIKPLDITFETDRNLLFVGLWGGKGGYWEDRKNVAALVRLFYETFKENSRAGLILKTQLVNGSSQDRAEVERRLKEIKSNFRGAKCKVYLIHEDLSDTEMWGLYSHPQVTGFVSLTAGEGFGRPLLEAAACGKPVLATNWSGHLDFLREKHGFIPIDYDLVEIPECQVWPGVLEKGSKWARVREDDVRKKMKKFIESPTIIRKQAESMAEFLNESLTRGPVHHQWEDLFNSFIREEGKEPKEGTLQKTRRERAIDHLRGMIEESDRKKAVYVIPQSAGDCLISTAIVNSLITFRHSDCDFYIATSPQFMALFDKIVEMHGARIIPFDQTFMDAELTREVFDYVYNPGVNIQYNFSNWLLGNGEYSVRLLEEFAKQCNLMPGEITDYKVKIEPCKLPESAYVVIAPGGIKSAKWYKYWPDVIANVKEMLPGIECVQIGLKNEDLIPGCLDYRGKTYAESFHIVKNAHSVLAVDTFGAHMAGAMGVPHLVLYGSTHSTTCCPVMIKKVAPQITIETDVCNPKCYKNECSRMKDGKNCLSHIAPETVLAGVQKLILKIEEKDQENDD